MMMMMMMMMLIILEVDDDDNDTDDDDVQGPGGQFVRAEGGEDVVYKHRDLFIIGQFTSGYHPVLNIR